jgi:hypothetical protein
VFDLEEREGMGCFVLEIVYRRRVGSVSFLVLSFLVRLVCGMSYIVLLREKMRDHSTFFSYDMSRSPLCVIKTTSTLYTIVCAKNVASAETICFFDISL